MRYVHPLRLCEVLTKSKTVGGRLLGLDVGNKYVGLAVSDPQNIIASPLSVLLRKKNNIDLMASDFETLVSKFSLAGLIVGYPYGKGSSSVDDAMHIKAFMNALSQTGKLKGLTYTYWHEGYSSKNVELLLKSLPLHPVEYKTMLDKFAAVEILQVFLDHINKSKSDATEPS